MSGIIPARAGFTLQEKMQTGRDADHPRSRGVYSLRTRAVKRLSGSSPLARGLLEWSVSKEKVNGIIPARAGFTIETAVDGSTPPDHPRSRGVYRPVLSTYTTHSVDHPRSRGVYSLIMNVFALTCGSSPLARGLRTNTPQRITCHGIIPARAGFTRTGDNTGIGFEDHPRSRGVYSKYGFNDLVRLGSSPLARGLPLSARISTTVTGIIPARAGFTFGSYGGSVIVRDHPRSRGVYWRKHAGTPAGMGSSPLARGLLHAPSGSVKSNRIIPARAGFTLGDRRDSNGGPPYQGAFAFTGDLGTARLSCGSVVAGQRSTTTPSPV